MSFVLRSLPYVAVILAALGVIVAILRSIALIRAERAWVKAMRNDYARRRILADYRKESAEIRKLAQSRWSERFLDHAVAELVESLGNENAIPDEARRTIEAGLNQPSETGRNNYAQKLVEEGLTGKVLIA